MAEEPTAEAQAVLEIVSQMVEELPDRRDNIWQAQVNERMEREATDPITDAAVAELLDREIIEQADPPLPGMTGPASFRYRLWEGDRR